MFTPWLKRKALKRSSRSKTLVVTGDSPSRIMLLSLTALCVMVGLYAVQRSLADNVPPEVVSTPTPTVTASQSPTPTPSPLPVSSER